MVLNLEVSVIAGSSIDQAASEMAALSRHLNIMCQADFNGCRLLSVPGTDPASIVAEYVSCVRARGGVHGPA